MDLFNRILRVIQQTGERCVVIDRQTNTAVVVQPWPAYEHGVGGFSAGAVASPTSDELLEKINRDVAEWREANQEVEDDEDSLDTAQNGSAVDGGAHGSTPATEQFYFEPIE